MSYPFGNTITPDIDLVPEAFMYKFTHRPTKRWYIGMHGLKEHESPFDGSYWNSSTDDGFKTLLEANPLEFDYEITNYGTMREMFKLENQTLTKLDAQNSKLSWNKWNGFVYETDELPRLKLIDELAKNAYDKNSGLERVMEDVADLYEGLVRLQVRFDNNLSHKKISEYRNEMKANNGTKGFTLTIVRRDGQKVLVGGNHTLESAKNFKRIEVVYIDEDLTMEEMQALGNALNRKVEIQRMTTAIGDCASDLVDLYKSKKIKDSSFKDKYSTDYIKITGGFKGNEITKVRKEARYLIEEQASWKKGKKWIDWTDNGTKHKRVDEKLQLASAQTDNITFCTTSSATFRADRIQEDWIKDADMRKKIKLKPRSNIKILMHYKDQKTLNEFVKNQNMKIHKRILVSFLKGEDIKNPIVIFEDLEFWEDKIS